MADNMKEPDYSKMFPRRFITMSMADKYTAVCFIFDGVQYQNLCRIENPDGTFNYSENCLNRLSQSLPNIGFVPNSSQDSQNSLVPYAGDSQADFPDILSAISHYWIQVTILCLFTAILLNLLFAYFGNRNRGAFYQKSVGPVSDESGKKLRMGKIAFDTTKVLGHGSKGTVVFKGKFEGSVDCAVKRIVSQYITIADREVDFLRSLQHPNLVRYFATEEDAQFIYIALELAESSLSQFIEADRFNDIGLSREELCRQAALGLRHLHKLDIVHRDIKPQNILISFPMKPSNERKVMISDFGLSKQLNNLDVTSTAMRYFDGTQGWIAPEVVTAKMSGNSHIIPSKSADIFSLGCVFYYIITDGEHPFGSPEMRQDNIISDNNFLIKYSLDLKGDGPLRKNLSEETALLASKLILAAIMANPEDRPSIEPILKHPFFWNASEKLQFLSDVSDRIDKLDRSDDLLRSLQRGNRKVLGCGWLDGLDQDVQNEIFDGRRSYDKNSLKHLLRVIRNKKNHFREISEKARVLLGDFPDGYLSYFTSRFPELLPHVYHVMYTCKGEEIFIQYYEQDYDYSFP